MNQQPVPEISNDLEKALLAFYTTPEPGPAFLTRLERRLLDRHVELLTADREREVRPASFWKRFSGAWHLKGWQAAALAVVLALLLALGVIGPGRVLAEVQRLLRYVPGIGFVDLDHTRVLASPVEVEQDGISLRVEQVIAGVEHTQVIFSSPGISEEDLPWPNPALEHPDFDSHLRLPDGNLLEPSRWTLNIGAASLEFPALPPDVYRVILEVNRLPLVPEGRLPENWQVPLMLRPATGELADRLFPQPYSPQEASDTHQGITLRVLDVAQGPQETAIRWQVEWPKPGWEFFPNLHGNRMPELRDDLGHVYWESFPSTGSSVAVVAIPAPDNAQASPTPAGSSQTGTMAFPSLSLSAHKVTLWVDSLEFEAPADGGFTFDIGNRPRVGDAWPLDLWVDIAGFPVHITAARILEESQQYNNGQSEKRLLLEFDVDVPSEKDGFRLRRFDLSSLDFEAEGSGGSSSQDGSFKTSLYFSRSGAIPSGPIRIQASRASLLALGPWEVSWTVPGSGEGKAEPVTLAPREASRARSGVRLGVEQAFMSDKITAVQLGTRDLPPGVIFVRPSPYDLLTFDPKNWEADLYLEDNWGRRYELGKNEAFLLQSRGDQELDPHWLTFPPMEPFAQNATLHIPGVELWVPGQAALEIDVPAQLAFKPEEYPVTVVGGGGPERQEMRTRWVSDPWPVDIQVEVAGYRLHFSRARVSRDEGTGSPYQLELTGEPQVYRLGEQTLSSLSFAAVIRPDGQAIRIDHNLQDTGRIGLPQGGIGREDARSGSVLAGLTLDVTAGNWVDFLPGRYQIELDGVTVWVQGPWELSWSLSGR